MSGASDLRVDGARLLDRLDALAEVAMPVGSDAATQTRGCSRLAFTDADRAGRELVLGWMRDLALDVRVDAIGNIVGVRGSTDAAPVMTGSHLDTVRGGGRYDGALGVLAGLEVVEVLDAAGVTTRRPLAVACFANEEGARFPPDMMGSMVYVGGMVLEEALDVVDTDGQRVADELERTGSRGSHPVPGPSPAAFVELHIEQGPVLEAEGVTIGAVESVQGISWRAVSIDGEANHAGTTPMSLRHDAGYAAGAIAAFARDLAVELGGAQVATVGSVRLHPDLVNVVASHAECTVDLRNTNDAVLVEAERRLDVFLDELAAAEGVTIGSRSIARFAPVTFAPGVVDLVERTARELGQSVRRMPSGAGHDAQMLARVCPAGMVFVPSHRGISHNPAEHTDPADVTAGADVLLQVLVSLSDADVLPVAGPVAAGSPASTESGIA